MADEEPKRKWIKGNIIDRHEWKALPSRRMMPTQFPFDKILVTVDNSYGPCCTKKECIEAVQEVQKYYILGKRMVDLPYSFLVGYDGFVYEGRGFNVKSHQSEFNPEFKERTLDIGVMGGDNNVNEDVDKDPMHVIMNFIESWVSQGIIAENYTMRLF